MCEYYVCKMWCICVLCLYVSHPISPAQREEARRAAPILDRVKVVLTGDIRPDRPRQAQYDLEKAQ